jgi:hypothetical protein
MVLLCAGVIIAGSTFQGFAATYDVTATVPAQPLTSPATITAPYHQQHVPHAAVQVSGICPGQSYVKLFRSAVFSGVSQCTDNKFQIQTNLNPGENSLEAKVYNITDDEGPASAPVTVYHDTTTVMFEPPTETPTTLTVDSVETNTYKKSAVREVSDRPTVSGYAPPFSDVTVTFYSDPVTCKTQADSQGWWSCTLQQALPEGTHRVEVIAQTTEGKTLKFPPFQIKVVPSKANLLLRSPETTPVVILADYRYQAHLPGEAFSWELTVTGGIPPYAVAIEWGDDSRSSIPTNAGEQFAITHAFPEPKTYQPLVIATDKKGATAVMQLSAVVQGIAATANITSDNKGSSDSFFAWFRQYVWLVWPVYGAVVLMAVSFWLGEKEVFRRLSERRGRPHPPTVPKGGFK